MEFTDKIKRDRIQIAIMIGIYLAIVLLLVAIIVLVKNIQEIKSDPIPYGIEKKDFAVCTCYDMKGNSYDYNAAGQIMDSGWNIEFPLS